MSTIDTIYTAVKAQLGDTYTVLSSYDASDEINPHGSLAVNVTEFENLHHQGCSDYRFGVTVSGFTTADEDRTRAVIYAMENHVLQSLDTATLQTAVSGCVGIVMGNMTTQSDGESNEFYLSFDLYVCNAVFAC